MSCQNAQKLFRTLGFENSPGVLPQEKVCMMYTLTYKFGLCVYGGPLKQPVTFLGLYILDGK